MNAQTRATAGFGQKQRIISAKASSFNKSIIARASNWLAKQVAAQQRLQRSGEVGAHLADKFMVSKGTAPEKDTRFLAAR